ncbi:hypothetical protein ACWDTI_00105 [Gordonia sp. NPDC003424]
MTMRPLECEQCGRRVQVEKFSAVHTSIQWMSDAAECPLIAAGHHGLGDAARECPALRRSIDHAVRDELLPDSRIELPVGARIPRLH